LTSRCDTKAGLESFLFVQFENKNVKLLLKITVARLSGDVILMPRCHQTS